MFSFRMYSGGLSRAARTQAPKIAVARGVKIPVAKEGTTTITVPTRSRIQRINSVTVEKQ